MTHNISARTDIETVPISKPYPGRTRPLPWSREEVTAAWLTEILNNKYPGVVAEKLHQVEYIDSHTAKIRMHVEWNSAGLEAELPYRLCLKANFLRDYNNVDICAVEARFYHFLSSKVKAPTPKCFYADWEEDGSRKGALAANIHANSGGFRSGPHHVALYRNEPQRSRLPRYCPQTLPRGA